MNNEGKQNRKPVLLLTTEGSHINLIDKNFNIFSDRYQFYKFKAHTDYPQYEPNLTDFLENICEADKNSNGDVIVVMANVNSIFFCQDYIDILKQFKDIKGFEKSKFPDIILDNDGDITGNYMCWFKFFKYIQDNLDNEICFLFTTHYSKNKYIHLMELANNVGLRNFRFIEDPFLTRELDKQLDHLILRYYTNKLLYNRRMNQRRKENRKTSNE